MNFLALLLAIIAYGLFYAASPGRQATPMSSPRVLQIGGTLCTIASIGLSVIAYGPAIGPIIVLTVMITAASILAMTGPFLLSNSSE